MRFVWFWTFWHWSRESFRAGALLRAPLHGIGSHWDEWYRHEASPDERQAIEFTGRKESSQRQFIAWLCQHWAREVDAEGNRMIPPFVLGQLAQVPPFCQWAACERYRTGYGVGGISAVVLAEESRGEREDVHGVEAVILPSGGGGISPTVVSEGFHADAADLETPRQAAMSLLSGSGLLVFLALWTASGRRPYPRWLQISLAAGWLAAGGMILYLLLGPDPGERLYPFTAGLLMLWSVLVLTALAVAGTQSIRAWRLGKSWHALLKKCQVRLRMNGGLTLKGGSAGLCFCLNTLLSVYRAHPPAARRSWLWRRFLRNLRGDANAWAATGVVTAEAGIRPVVIEPKLRASLQHPHIRHLLTPGQRGAGQHFVDRLAATLPSPEKHSRLRAHPQRHVAQSMMTLGNFSSRWQLAVNVFAAAVSAAMLAALSDMKCILLPPPAPVAVAPSSPSPYYLWVSLDTQYPGCFQIVMESDYWANRRVDVAPHDGANASVRAEVRLHRLSRQTAKSESSGIVWIERRNRFLSRKFGPGERVGRYTLSYLTGLGHE